MAKSIPPDTSSNVWPEQRESETKVSLAEHSVEDLKSHLEEIKTNPAYKHFFLQNDFAKPYRDEITTRDKVIAVAILALVVTGIVVFSLFATNHLFSFPQDFVNLFQNASRAHICIGVAVTAVLFSGSLIVIHRAQTKPEELLKDEEGNVPTMGTMSNLEDKLEIVRLRLPEAWKNNYLDAYVDTSTLVDGTGKAYLYYIKDCTNHYVVSTVVALLGTPFYIIGAIVLNAIRMVVVPLYILTMCLIELCQPEPYFNTEYPAARKFSVLDAGIEFLQSIYGIIKAPFYGIAFFFAALYSLINPMEGRKLGSAIERNWNDGANLAEGYWSVDGEQPLWRRDGAWGPEGLRRKRFFLAGCWQPIGVVEYVDHAIQDAYWIPKAVDLYEKVERQKHEDFQTKSQRESNYLIEEYKAFEKELRKREPGKRPLPKESADIEIC